MVVGLEPNMYMSHRHTMNAAQTSNAVAEAFFSSMKREELYRRNYRSEKDFRDSVAAYIHFYNTERPHRSNDYHSPDYVERECRRAHK